MKMNEHNIDRVIRVVLALVLAGAALYFESIILGVIALVPLLTGLIGFCPLYSMIGMSTRVKNDA